MPRTSLVSIAKTSAIRRQVKTVRRCAGENVRLRARLDGALGRVADGGQTPATPARRRPCRSRTPAIVPGRRGTPARVGRRRAPALARPPAPKGPPAPQSRRRLAREPGATNGRSASRSRRRRRQRRSSAAPMRDSADDVPDEQDANRCGSRRQGRGPVLRTEVGAYTPHLYQLRDVADTRPNGQRPVRQDQSKNARQPSASTLTPKTITRSCVVAKTKSHPSSATSAGSG